jgi:hypothetical protein
MFCGNHQATEHAAIIYTLPGCCREVDVNPREWLIDVLEKLPYFLRDKKDLTQLLPAYWKNTRNIRKSSVNPVFLYVFQLLSLAKKQDLYAKQ